MIKIYRKFVNFGLILILLNFPISLANSKTFPNSFADLAEKLMPAVFYLYEQWNRRVPTPALNRWLLSMTENHPPPLVNGRRLRLRYITQARTRPPTFILFSTRADKVSPSYLRYLANGLRGDFNLWGTPLRLNVRKRKNPYEGRKKK